MAVILNSAMLDSDTLFSFWLRLHSKTLSLHSDFWHQSNLAILDWATLVHSPLKLDDGRHLANLAILDSAILVVPLKTSLPLAKIGSHHLHKKTFTHSFWLNLMMAAILNSTMLD